MNKSEMIDELATALSKAQSCIEDATKSTEAYNYKYADLSQILRLVRPVFAENGLSITQFPCDGGSSVSLESMLMHSSGQWLSQKFSMDVEASKGMSKAQSAGVVITYMRRYSLSAIAGLTQEDNDAALERKKAAEPAVDHSKAIATFCNETDQAQRDILWGMMAEDQKTAINNHINNGA